MKNKALEIAVQGSTVSVALKVALLVGLLLNLINQGDVLLSGDLINFNFAKALFTFFVPYAGSTYSTVKAKLAFQIGMKSAVDAHVKCHHCYKTEVSLPKGKTIPVCPICIEKTDYKVMGS